MVLGTGNPIIIFFVMCLHLCLPCLTSGFFLVHWFFMAEAQIENQIINSAIDFILSHLEGGISVDDVAEVCGFSKHFQKNPASFRKEIVENSVFHPFYHGIKNKIETYEEVCRHITIETLPG